MPFTHKDGTLVFVDRDDVEQHYQPLLKPLKAEYLSQQDGKPPDNKYQNLLERISECASSFRIESEKFLPDHIDNYYLTAIAAAESEDELMALDTAYNDYLVVLCGVVAGKIYARQEEVKLRRAALS